VHEPDGTSQLSGTLKNQPALHGALTKIQHLSLTLLYGRRTYEEMAAAWPERTGDMADRFNSIPKFVVSTTLQEATWNNSRLIKGNIVEEVSRLKQQFGQAIRILGSGDLVRTLMHHHLIDAYVLVVCPLILGKGKRLFQDASRTTLRLVTSKAYTTGAVWLTYQPVYT
jgi:dihydrofolate reductase